MNDPDEPSPVPAGMSATLTISMPGCIVVALEHLADQGVLDVLDPRDPLVHGVLQEVVVGEGRVDGQVDVLVDGRRQHRTALAPVVRGQIGAPAADGDPQRRAGQDHATSLGSTAPGDRCIEASVIDDGAAAVRPRPTQSAPGRTPDYRPTGTVGDSGPTSVGRCGRTPRLRQAPSTASSATADRMTIGISAGAR